MRLEIGEIWFGKDGTSYQGIIATIKAITTRNVQLTYDLVVNVDGVRLRGEVMTQKKFQTMFEPYRQGGLF
jgi:hypothetical protein